MSNLDLVTVQVPVKHNVLVLGHSFVARLGNDVSRIPSLRPDFEIDQAVVHCLGFRGGVVGHLIEDTSGKLHHELHTFRPEMVILQIGGNDIDNKQNYHPQVYMESVKHFITKLQTVYQVQKVVLCEIFPRRKVRQTDVDFYNEEKDMLNRELDSHYSVRHPSPGVVFWYHRGGITSSEGYFDKHGVHLNDEGTKRFYFSIRRAIGSIYPEW
ncbi:unnamed protein product [Mytilus coruscus]|uniref:SGNH hydrolase-type esterase domain-containing protein n=1 Tax=Mytilus coruscus TaxID=42192 RepID=A0A6J8ERR8_MYTCO|nr:unnamed protein product [Mytilus coruscus]